MEQNFRCVAEVQYVLRSIVLLWIIFSFIFYIKINKKRQKQTWSAKCLLQKYVYLFIFYGMSLYISAVKATWIVPLSTIRTTLMLVCHIIWIGVSSLTFCCLQRTTVQTGLSSSKPIVMWDCPTFLEFLSYHTFLPAPSHKTLVSVRQDARTSCCHLWTLI